MESVSDPSFNEMDFNKIFFPSVHMKYIEPSTKTGVLVEPYRVNHPGTEDVQTGVFDSTVSGSFRSSKATGFPSTLHTYIPST